MLANCSTWLLWQISSKCFDLDSAHQAIFCSHRPCRTIMLGVKTYVEEIRLGLNDVQNAQADSVQGTKTIRF